MGLYFGETELTGLYFGDIELTALYFGDIEIWAAWAEYDGTLPAQYSANGSTLADYRVYGSAGGVGDRTVNLFDKDNTVGIINNYYIKPPGKITQSINYYLSAPMSVTEGDIYTWTRYKVTLGTADGVGFFDENDNIIGAAIPSGGTSVTFTIPVGCDHVRASVHKSSVGILMLTEGSTAPAEYVPYGYVVPMSVSDGTTSTTMPIYIGDEPLGEDEYIDYQVGKVYQRTKNLVGIFESVEINDVEFKFDGACVYISGTASATIPANNQIFMAFNFTLKAGTYNIREYGSQQQTGFGGWILYDQNFTRIVYSNTAFTLSEDTDVFFGFYVVANRVLDFSIRFVILPDSEGAITEYIPYYNPQDPPVPLLALPTVDGTTITDYAGQSAAVPSRFYAKYRRGDIYEFRH